MKHILPAILLVTGFAACGKGGGEDNPAPKPTISIQDFSMFEGNGGSSTFNVVVKLSAASSQAVSVNYSTGDLGAKAGDDYTAISNQTLTFAANETQKTIPVTIVADDLREGEDDFKIVLSSPVNATISKGTNLIIIRNDDTRITFATTGYTAPDSYAGYTRVWEDNFDGTAINSGNWAFQNGDGCPNVCGWGNNELEWYTDRAENLFFQDGYMIISAQKESYGGKNYTSSKLLSQGKKKFKYGRIDFRAKLPIGKGIWPAFWMLPENSGTGWPRSGEIDIMENVGHEPKTTVGTLHFGPGPGSTQFSKTNTIATNLADEFHVYSLIWKEDQIQWLLDGLIFSTANRTDLNLGGADYPFNADFFFIINLAVGGNWPGSPNDQTVFPQYYIVDYLRVYQQ